ncbi:DNA cytosine methyltransferase [Sphingomonas bacterium]|uniref:DNA cytosine methyltransferase n=1 Tax=Sphingomonas bacterium TaxID=1895847 RepID=UPI001C2DE6B8|nr:DNA (cytosine-5-)-methyltransferase [Sphingomonas bacterium]
MVAAMDAKPGFYEFFAGGGMARAGLGDRWECLFANDIDPKKGAAYAANWGAAALHVGDVVRVAADQLPGRADLVWASFPCQDLSLAGAGAGLAGERSGVFWPFWRLMTALADTGRKPRAIVLENVCGLITSHGGADFAALCRAVAAAGYGVGALVVDAQLFVPQSRPRLFAIATDLDESAPASTSAYAVDQWHPMRLRQAQAALPEQIRRHWRWYAPAAPVPRTIGLIDVVEERPADVAWHDAATTARLLAMMSPVNRMKVDAMAASSGSAVGTVYKRTRIEQGRKVQRAEVRFDMAGCLRTPAGGSSRQTIITVEGGRVRSRLMSARETARLMGLGDDYRLPSRYSEAYHLTGDGVAVPVVRHLARTILEPMLMRRSASVPV